MLYFRYMRRLINKPVGLLISTILLSFFVITPAEAKDPKLTIRHESMAAKYAGQSLPDPIEIEAGQLKNVIVKFKNVGSETWPTAVPDASVGASKNFISAYTVEPRDR